MKSLEKKQICALAAATIQSPELNAFRTRLITAYTLGFGYRKGLTFLTQSIQDNRIMVKDTEESEPRYIPVHPVLVQILQTYPDGLPAFEPDRFFEWAEQLAAIMQPDDTKSYILSLKLTFRSSMSGYLHMEAEGIPVSERLLLADRTTMYKPENPAFYQELMNEIFHAPFFDYLMPLAEQHGLKIEWA